MSRNERIDERYNLVPVFMEDKVDGRDVVAVEWGVVLPLLSRLAELEEMSREVAAQALDEAAAALVVDRVEGSTYSAGLPLVTAEWASAHTERWLRARAASIRSGATS